MVVEYIYLRKFLCGVVKKGRSFCSMARLLSGQQKEEYLDETLGQCVCVYVYWCKCVRMRWWWSQHSCTVVSCACR